MVKKQSRPEEFLALVKTSEIYDGFLKGLSVQQIADKLEVTEEAVTQQITRYKNQITADQIDLAQRFTALTLKQTDMILFKVLDAIDRQTSTEKGKDVGPSRDMIKAALDLWKFRKELVVPDSSHKEEMTFKIQQTFTYDNPLGKEALQNLQTDYLGHTVHEVDSPTVIELPENIKRLNIEELATKYNEEDGIEDSD